MPLDRCLKFHRKLTRSSVEISAALLVNIREKIICQAVQSYVVLVVVVVVAVVVAFSIPLVDIEGERETSSSRIN